MPFDYTKTEIPDVILIKSTVFTDKRGFFSEIHRNTDFNDHVDTKINFVQDNFSISNNGVLRGLHIQLSPFMQGKLVSCLNGRILDVAVDLRLDSDYYGKHVKVKLDLGKVLYIPPGFAHGFLSLEDETVVFYKNTNEYSPEHDSGVVWNDKVLNIKWPLSNPIVSSKDKNLSSFKELEGKLKNGRL